MPSKKRSHKNRLHARTSSLWYVEADSRNVAQYGVTAGVGPSLRHTVRDSFLNGQSAHLFIDEFRCSYAAGLGGELLGV